ncbi:transposase [Vibrio sp. ABG19]|uniref:transposase n=1 Tax=Vibrio sp. ABG19 TaxID=2817385 RepID=UPI00249F01F3|nr:transposase [Vibrio sp. ABG19]WGY47115.1 transposase [Vibrio sp. ABG19]
MTTARSQLIRPDVTPYYHCVSRCVRRSYLCGYDKLSGQSYEHRRDWVEQRILSLAAIYCVRICAYAIMSNHYHLVTFIDTDAAQSLSELEVVERWGAEHTLPVIIQRYISQQLTCETEWNLCHQLIDTWRQRLCSLSWFMKELNYDIAVQANREDDCTGRFWEGRFKSQALLDEKALLAAMAYVDLNPIRANIAPSLKQSDHTSIKFRLSELEKGNTTASPLSDFVGYQHQDKAAGIPFRLSDYLELLDWIGRQLRPDKKGRLDATHPFILQQLTLPQQTCLRLCTQLEKQSGLWIGSTPELLRAKDKLKRKRMCGVHIS